MSSWAEIEHIRKDAPAFRALAARLLLIVKDVMTEWELEFVEDICRRTNVSEFTLRQSEKLLQIRDDTQTIEKWRGFSVARLIEQCHDARLDLSEDDEAWIVAVRAARTFRRRSIGRLATIAAQLGIIEEQNAA